MRMIDIVFDGPPGAESGRFVEVECDGAGIAIGEWVSRPGGYWALRLPVAGRAPGPHRDDIQPALDPGAALKEAQAIAQEVRDLIDLGLSPSMTEVRRLCDLVRHLRFS